MGARGDGAIEHDVAVEDAAHLVGDRLFHVTALDEHGVDGGDRALLALTAALEQARQHGEDARRVAATGRRLSGGEADLALRACDARDGVDEQEHALTLIAEVLGDGRGHVSGAQALDRWRVAGGDHGHRALSAGLAERVLEELADLTPALADQRDHDDVGASTARQRAEQRALADAGAGEEAEALTDADAEKAVDGADPGRQWALHGSPAQCRGRRAVDGNGSEAFGQGLAVERASQAVEHAAEQGWTSTHFEGAASRLDGVVGTDSAEVAEGQCQRHALIEADYLRDQRLTPPAHHQEVADASARDGNAQKHAGHPDHAAHGPQGGGSRELGAQRLEIHGLTLTQSRRRRDMFAPTRAKVRGFVTVKTAVTLLVVCLSFGCRANVRGSASVDGSANASGDFEGNASGEGESGEPASATGTPAPETDDFSPTTAGEIALLGARHDLTLVSERATNKCQCLAVAIGEANLAAFRWKAGTPKLDPETQLVVAQTSEGQSCAEPKGSLGASYWGYRIKGNDVFVFVESAVSGRPLTAGGIIPKPFADGQVYIAPATKKTPYGRGTDGAAQCKLGNPGTVRSKPLDSAEQGSAGVEE